MGVAFCRKLRERERGRVPEERSIKYFFLTITNNPGPYGVPPEDGTIMCSESNAYYIYYPHS